MSGALPILACGSMKITPAAWTLIITVLVCWAFSFVLAIGNPILIWRTKASGRFKQLNFGLYGLNVALAALLFIAPNYLASPPEWFGYILVSLIFVVPVMAIGHFIFLVRAIRKFRWQDRTRTEPGTSVASAAGGL